VILEETLQTSEVSPKDLGGLIPGIFSEVTILWSGVDEIELAVGMEDEGFVVLSNQYDPGWRAYVDGREERIYRANYILMAVPLTKGSHKVKFVYEPAMHQINLLVRFIVPFCLAGALLYRGRDKKEGMAL
jgi:uncharacterized membrane protein YfhO